MAMAERSDSEDSGNTVRPFGMTELQSHVPEKARIRYAAVVFLAALAGWVDAVSFVRWNGLYVSFMSGNTTTLAVSSIEHHWAEAARRASVVAAFVLGAVCGEMLGRWAGRKRANLVPIGEAVLLLAAALLGWLHPSMVLVPAVLAVAMGVQNAALRRAGRYSIAVTYVTGTIVRFGRAIVDSLYNSHASRVALPYLGVWCAFLLGAAAGAAAAGWSGTGAIVVPAILLVGFAFVSDLRNG